MQSPHHRARDDHAARAEACVIEQARQRRERARSDDDGVIAPAAAATSMRVSAIYADGRIALWRACPEASTRS